MSGEFTHHLLVCRANRDNGWDTHTSSPWDNGWDTYTSFLVGTMSGTLTHHLLVGTMSGTLTHHLIGTMSGALTHHLEGQ